MVTMNKQIGFLLLSSFKLTGICVASVFIVFLSFYKLAFLHLFAILVFIAVLKLSLKRASTSSVENVLGPLWGAFAEAKKNDNGKGLKIIAHRACGLDAPENSLSALRNIIKEDIKAVEFDVMLTADNVPVVFHDDSLSRMTDSSKLVRNVTWSYLQDLNLSQKHPFGKLCPDEKIPSMDKFVQCCLKGNTTMLIDIKDLNIVPHIVAMFQKYPNLEDKVLVSSFDPRIIYKIRKANTSIIGCVAWRPYYYSHGEYSAENGAQKRYSENPLIRAYHSVLNASHEWLLWNFVHHILGISAILLHKDMITKGIIQYWKNRDVRVLAWTVNSPAEKIFFERVLQIPYLTDTVIGS